MLYTVVLDQDKTGLEVAAVPEAIENRSTRFPMSQDLPSHAAADESGSDAESKKPARSLALQPKLQRTQAKKTVQKSRFFRESNNGNPTSPMLVLILSSPNRPTFRRLRLAQIKPNAILRVPPETSHRQAHRPYKG